MKKAVFLYDDGLKNMLAQVYPDRVLKKIAEQYDLIDGFVSNKELAQRAEELKQVQAIFSSWWMPALQKEEIQQFFPRLEIVFYGAGSVQYFARPFLELGIKVVSGWVANGVPVAEYTVSQIVLANKGFFQNTRIMHGGNVAAARSFTEACYGNYGARVGILGAGTIGRRVIGMLTNNYHMDVSVYDPYLSSQKAETMGVRKCTIEEIFSKCDVISNHVAKLPATEGMIHYELLKLMKPYATLINTGRGSQIVEADLIRALTEVPTRTALLDVTDPEPPLPESPLYTMDNVVLSSHIAGSVSNEVERIGEYMIDESTRFAQNSPLQYEVTLKALETMA